MKTKFISMALTLTMAATFVPSLVVNAAGEETVSFTASSSAVSRGETFTYVVSLDGADDLRGLQAGLDYDETKVTLVNYNFGSDAPVIADYLTITDKDGVVGIAFAGSDAVNLNGDLAILEFKVNDDAASGNAGFALTESGVKLSYDANELFEPEVIFNDVSINYDYTADLTATTDSDVVYNDSEVTYRFSLSELNDMRGLQATFAYDTDVVTLESAEVLGVVAEDTYVPARLDTDVNGKVSIAADYAEPTLLSGEILELKFKVISGLAEGDYTPVSVDSFEVITSSKEVADLDLNFVADSVTVSRESYIEMSYVTDKEEVKAGETFVYTVTLDEISQSRGFQAKMEYDSKKLELVSAVKGEVLTDCDLTSGIVTATPGEVSFVCGYLYDDVLTGKVAELTFRVKTGVADGYIDVEAPDVLAVKGIGENYEFVDSGSRINIEKIYVGRLPRTYGINLTADKSFYVKGETVSLTVDLGELDKFTGIQFKLGFDTDAVKYIKPSRISTYYGPVMKGATSKQISSYRAESGSVELIVAYGTISPYTGNETLCTIQFEAVADISAYTAFEVIEITPQDGDIVTSAPLSVYVSEGAKLNDTITLIDSIGTLDSSDNVIIETAKEAYSSLTDEEKEYVTNYNVLETAEIAMPVFIAIEAIGTVTLESEEAIKAARVAYNMLPYMARAMIDSANYKKLTDAEVKFEELKPVYNITHSLASGVLTVEMANNKSDITPVLLVAQYAEDGRMLNIKIHTVTIDKGDADKYITDIFDDTAKVKMMLWEDVASMKPYTAALKSAVEFDVR